MLFQAATDARRGRCPAYGPSVQNEPVAEIVRPVRRYYPAQNGFDPDRVLLAVYKTDPVAQPDAMRVHGNASRLAEHVSEDEICRLSSYAGELQQLFHGPGNLSSMLLKEDPGAADDLAGLGEEEPAGPDHLLKFFPIGISKGFQSRKFREQGGGDKIHPGVRTLG